ncbi:MAG: hypothetical protein U1F57_09665 [bacterium]
MTPPQMSSSSQYPQGIPPQAMPYPPQQTKSGCGCCGCLTGCLVALMIPPLILLVLYFTVDFGKWTDRAMIWGYHEVFRPQVLEPALSGAKPEDKKLGMEVFDHFVDAYDALPESEKKEIRHEIPTFLYYQMNNQKAPPEKVAHLTQFFQNQMEILKKKYPQMPSEIMQQIPQTL